MGTLLRLNLILSSAVSLALVVLAAKVMDDGAQRKGR
jgi:hypothetical protein